MALEYCHRKKENPYPAIFWVDATTEDTVKGSSQSISERIKRRTDYLPDINAKVAFVLKVFACWTVPWLMVFDNYDNPDAFPNIRDFIPQSELGAMLVISKHPDSNALVINQSNHFIELFGFEENAAVALLIQRSQTNEGISVDAKKIVQRLGCHPLAVMQAGACIRKRKLRLCECMDHYGEYVTAPTVQKKARKCQRGNIIECVYDLGTLVPATPISGLKKGSRDETLDCICFFR